jgi:hypothetical protein
VDHSRRRGGPLVTSGRLGGTLFTRCIFCHKKFPENGVFGRLPPGRRLAFGTRGEGVVALWARAGELAHIIDEQLTPDDVRERHYRRLPVTVRQTASTVG